MAHGLVSVAGNAGAGQLSQLAREIEQDCRKNQTLDMAARVTDLAKVASATGQLIEDWLAAYLCQPAAKQAELSG